MCGDRLEGPSEPAQASPQAVQESCPADVPSRPSSSILGLDPGPVRGQPFQREPSIAGPSFLGIGAEPERRSSKYSYLFDYDEPRSHRGLWIALVLVFAAGLVGLKFRQELRARALPIYAAVLARVNPQPPTPPPTPAPTDSAGTAPQASAPTTANDALPGAGVAPDQKPQTTASQTPPPPANDNAPVAQAASEKPEQSVKSEPQADPAVQTNAPPKKTARRANYAQASQERPAAEAASRRNDALLQLAQKYIRGEGVRRDCATGLAYLREAARHPSSEAATQMGALYATGTCVPLDRVAAYRWFTSALQLDPSNPWLSKERDELYGHMSSSERRQADRQ